MKYLQKSFTIYMYNQKNTCDLCNKEAKYYIQTKEGRFCYDCYPKIKERIK